MNGEQVFDAAAALGRLIHDHAVTQREAKRVARNARRRRAYARNPRPSRAKAVKPTTDFEDVVEVGCLCHIVAPCTCCESGGTEGDAA